VKEWAVGDRVRIKAADCKPIRSARRWEGEEGVIYYVAGRVGLVVVNLDNYGYNIAVAFGELESVEL
jgi:ribosomal protein L21E